MDLRIEQAEFVNHSLQPASQTVTIAIPDFSNQEQRVFSELILEHFNKSIREVL